MPTTEKAVKPRAVLIHGMWVRDGGENSIGRLKPQLEVLGFDVKVLDYGFWSLLRTYFGKKLDTDQKVLAAIWDATLICTHSRGAVVAHRAFRLLPTRDRLRVLVNFSPALNKSAPVPKSVTHRYVFHTRRDWVVMLSALLPRNRMGSMGAVGYTGTDSNNTNIDESKAIKGHSTWFKGLNANQYAIRAWQMYRVERDRQQ